MNWGHKLLIVILLFLGSMIGVVFYASQQDNEMIDEHYYRQEVQYQQVIDAKKNLMAVSSEDMIHQTPTEVVLNFPVGTYEQMEEGTIELLRNDASLKDVRMDIRPTYADLIIIPKSKFSKGLYQARIKWRNGGKEYYREEKLFVE